LPEADVGRSRIGATVLYVDHFGNVQLNVTREHLDSVGVVPGRRVELDLGGDRYYAVAARTFADARRGDLVLYEDSYSNVSIAISNGNAADLLGARPGQELRIDVDVP
jgi:S-adenosylmethionine hydrolase